MVDIAVAAAAALRRKTAGDEAVSLTWYACGPQRR
jgi:hypothetical protein